MSAPSTVLDSEHLEQRPVSGSRRAAGAATGGGVAAQFLLINH
jgi:hypothetical protein